MTKLLTAVLVFLGSHSAVVAPEIQSPYYEALLAWYPHGADLVRSVAYCNPEECERLRSLNATAGYWDEGRRAIRVFRNEDRRALVLTLEHELGHALGLDHNSGYSIMNPSWAEPIAERPTDADREAVAQKAQEYWRQP